MKLKNYIKKTVIAITLFTLSIQVGCTFRNEGDEQVILEIYSQMMQAFVREDLRGVMENISKDFQSDIENQQNYSEVFEFRKMFILNNSNVSVDFRDITIEIDNSDALVTLQVDVLSDQLKFGWKEIDTLRKKWGKWNIYSWEIMKEN